MVHHRRGLRRLLRNDELVAAVEHDWTTAALSPKRTAMLRYAVKLTETSGAMNDSDVDYTATRRCGHPADFQ